MYRSAFAIIAAIPLYSSGCTGPDNETELRSELLEMGRKDQDVRERVVAFVRQGAEAMDTPEYRALVDEQNAVDEANYARLEKMFAQHGWPSVEAVGEDANGAAWVILQHANIERQRQFLAILRGEVEQGRVRASNFAELEDEVAMADSGHQIYGTEISVDLINGKASLQPVIDPGRLDERRASVGLPPIDVYLLQAEAQLGMPVDRSALSVQ